MWECPKTTAAVDVAVDGGDGGQLAQVPEHFGLAEVASVQDQVGVPRQLDAAIGQAAGAAWHVGVGEDREAQRSGR